MPLNYFHFFPTSLLHSSPTQDIESFDLEDFKYNSVNITAFRLVDVESKRVTEIMEQVKKVQKHSGRDLINGSSIMQVIIFNSLRVFFFQILVVIFGRIRLERRVVLAFGCDDSSNARITGTRVGSPPKRDTDANKKEIHGEIWLSYCVTLWRVLARR